MLSRIQCLGSCLIVLTLLLFAGSAGAQDVSPRCEAAMDRAAGHYSKCLLSADASFARHGNPTKLENRQARCETRFDRRTSRAFSRYGADECTSTELVAALADRTVTCAQGVATEAGGQQAASRMYVQDANGGTLTETTLVLLGIDESTPWFTDRPYREAGQMTTAEFVALFAEEGANSFAENPPNADFTCKSGGGVVNQAVTLTDPVLDETAGTLTYTAALVPTAGDDGSFAGITCDGDAHLFIDDTTEATEFEPPDCNMGWGGLINSQDCCKCIWFAGKIRSSLEDKVAATCTATCEGAAGALGGAWGAAIGAVGCPAICNWAEGELEDLIAQGEQDEFEQTLCFNISAPNPETGKNCFGYMCHELLTDGSGNDSCTTPCRAKCSDWVFNLYSPVSPTGCLTWWTGEGYETISKQEWCEGSITEIDQGATDWSSDCAQQCRANACATSCSNFDEAAADICECLQGCGVTTTSCQ